MSQLSPRRENGSRILLRTAFTPGRLSKDGDSICVSIGSICRTGHQGLLVSLRPFYWWLSPRIPRRRSIQSRLRCRRHNQPRCQPKAKPALRQFLPDRLRLKHLRSRKKQRNPLRHRRPLRSSPRAKRPSRCRCKITQWSKLRPSRLRRPQPLRFPRKPNKTRSPPTPQDCRATPSQGARSSRNVRPAILWSREKPSWVQAWPASSAASRRPMLISAILRQ